MLKKYKIPLIILLIACIITGIWYFFFRPSKPVKEELFDTQKTTQAARDEITKERADETIAMMRSKASSYDNAVSEKWCIDENGPYSISYDDLRDSMVKVQNNKAIARFNFSSYKWNKLREEPELDGASYDTQYVLDKIGKFNMREKYTGSFKQAPEHVQEFDKWLENYNYSYYDNLSTRTVYRLDEEKIIVYTTTRSGKSNVMIKEGKTFVVCEDVHDEWPILEVLQ